MKLYKIWQEVNNDYDTFDSAVVAARDEEDARSINPEGIPLGELKRIDNSSWTAPENVNVEFLGEAKPGTKPGVIVASFNAG